jgi:hypothetical protein
MPVKRASASRISPLTTSDGCVSDISIVTRPRNAAGELSLEPAERPFDQTSHCPASPSSRSGHAGNQVALCALMLHRRSGQSRKSLLPSHQFGVGGLVSGTAPIGGAPMKARDQYGCRRRAVQPHIRAGIGNANEQSRRRSERPRARPKRAVCPPPLPVPIGP